MVIEDLSKVDRCQVTEKLKDNGKKFELDKIGSQ